MLDQVKGKKLTSIEEGLRNVENENMLDHVEKNAFTHTLVQNL